MYIENRLVVHGDWETVWKLASEIENWPEWFPHYRRVELQLVSPEGRIKHAYMSCWRDILPVSWHTIQRLDYSDNPAEARVHYHHVKGVTTGMEVIWQFEPLATDVYRITISHDWTPGWPLVGKPASRWISLGIVHNIADKTLRRVRELAGIVPATVA